MPLPEPVPGLVVNYSYLWHREHLVHQEEGRKNRPCAVVAAMRRDGEEGVRVLVLPVTHRLPDRPDMAVELPALVKKRLGLDEARSWVVVTEWNDFLWPGPDLRPTSRRDLGTVAYGMLPPSLFKAIRDRFLAIARDKRAERVPRT